MDAKDDATDQEMQRIAATSDLLSRGLQLAAVVTRLFRQAGWELVVVGGSAIEFYTEGAYMSGDIDLCRMTIRPIPLRLAQDLMGRIGARGGPRSWLVAGLYVDLLGMLENEALTPCRTIETPCGSIQIIPPELAVVERVLQSYYPQPDTEARAVAKKILAVCMSGDTAVDWAEIQRLARLPAFNVEHELNELKNEVASELGDSH